MNPYKVHSNYKTSTMPRAREGSLETIWHRARNWPLFLEAEQKNCKWSEWRDNVWSISHLVETTQENIPGQEHHQSITHLSDRQMASRYSAQFLKTIRQGEDVSTPVSTTIKPLSYLENKHLAAAFPGISGLLKLVISVNWSSLS